MKPANWACFAGAMALAVQLALAIGLGLAAGAAETSGPGKVVVDTSASPHAKFRTVSLDAARWNGGFWGERYERCRQVAIPAMKQVLELPTNSATFYNLRLAAGEAQGKFFGNHWSDGDCYKWIEAAASVQAVSGDAALDRQMDEVIAVIAKAQAPDGYLATQIQTTGRPRWQDLKHHELYNMGHLLTAACIHHRATGKTNFLAVARKLADYLCAVFLPRPKELAHFGFNPSNIMGAAELYRVTREPKYLALAQCFVDMRGSQPGGTDQNQSKVPLRQEKEAVGHAVTAAYLWCGAADVCAETGEPALLAALQRIWEDVTTRKMYVTGGTAALHHGESQRALLRRFPVDSVHEAFGAPYQLPNRTAYNETCANIANAMWNWRMLLLTGDARHADVMERVFYNSLLSAWGLRGDDYFYTNPLRRAGPEVPLLNNDSAQRWTNTTPPSPVHCFCCPPSVARTVAQLATYAYGVSPGAVWIHLYGAGMLETRLPDGSGIRLSQETDYPWDGRIVIRFDSAPQAEIALRLRIPGWAREASVKINGEPLRAGFVPGTYEDLRRRWQPGDRVELDLPMEVNAMEAHPLVEENRNHVAIMRGPLVYCLESMDLSDAVRLSQVRVDRAAVWKTRRDDGWLRGAVMLESQGWAVPRAENSRGLYQKLPQGQLTAIPLRLVPYFAWCNRGPGEMSVWLPVR